MEAQPKLTLEEQKTQGSQDFHERISEGNFGLAETAFSAQQKKRYNRDVVIDFYSFFAVRAGGRRLNQAQASRQSIDNHVEEASPDQPE